MEIGAAIEGNSRGTEFRRCRHRLPLLLTFFAALTVPAPASAAEPAEMRVYLLTVGPGDQVWERFGHNAL